MSPITVGLFGFIAVFALLLLGLPVGFGMAAIGFAGLWYFLTVFAAISKLAVAVFDTVGNYSLAVLPLFLLMAHIIFFSGLAKDIYRLAARLIGHLPGGLAMATTAGSAGFAAMSASSLATVATMGLIALPEMKRYNYDPSLATGTLAAGTTIGILIPPSGILIIYGVLTEQSISKLFIGGIFPGILEAIFYIFTIYILCRWKPNLGPRGPRSGVKEIFASLYSCVEMVLLVLLVLGGLIIGWFTPTEAGAVGAFGAIVFSLFRKRLDWHKAKQALNETMKTTGMIYCILIGAYIFQYFVALTTIPTWLAKTVSALPFSPLGIMVLIILVYFMLGCFLDAMAMILLTIPVFFPVTISLGFDPIWFGIIVVRVMEMALITPPMGMNVFVVAGMAPDVPLSIIFKGIFPFLVADLFHVTLLLFVPSIVTYLPNIVG